MPFLLAAFLLLLVRFEVRTGVGGNIPPDEIDCFKPIDLTPPTEPVAEKPQVADEYPNDFAA